MIRRYRWFIIISLLAGLVCITNAQEGAEPESSRPPQTGILIPLHAAFPQGLTAQYEASGQLPRLPSASSFSRTHAARQPTTIDAELAAALNAALDAERERQNLQGISASVLVPDQGNWLGVTGWSDPVSGDTVSPDMLFGVGSVTKTYVAALSMSLVEDGLLTLDDSLGQWLPPFPNVNGAVTIRQLLSHTSGIDDFFNTSTTWLDSVSVDLLRHWLPEEILSTFVGPPVFEPGTQWGYSNTNYLCLGLIVEAATGNDFAAELHGRILDPLELTSTFLAPDEELEGTIVDNWEDFNGDGIPDNISLIPATALLSFTWTAGAMYATAGDLARWGQALFEGEVVSEASLDEMMAILPPSSFYGLGIFTLNLQGRETWGHNGSYFGFHSALLYSLDDRISMAVVINQRPADPISVVNVMLDVLLDHLYPVIAIEGGLVNLGDLPADGTPIDTGFYVYNIGGAPDSIDASIDYRGVDEDGMVIEPEVFSLIPGDSQLVTVTIFPELIQPGLWGPKAVIDSRFSAGQTHFEKSYLFNILDPVAIIADDSGLPRETTLLQNYPNPFNPTTQFGFHISGFGPVRIMVFDLQGQLVKTIINREMTPGRYWASWDGSNHRGQAVASGVYFYKLAAKSAFGGPNPETLVTRKMLLTR